MDCDMSQIKVNQVAPFSKPGVGIGTEVDLSETSVLLKMSSTTQGVLFPRMTQAQRDALNTPALYLIIHNITAQRLEQHVGGGVWKAADNSIDASELLAETNARIAADNAEASTRASADTALSNSLSAETTARQNADTTLQSNINAEATARANADSAEATARANADAAEASTRAAADTAETNARIAADALKVNKAGDTMSGVLNMGGNKIQGLQDGAVATDAATKGQVDTQDALRLLKAGDTMLGTLNMNGNRITNLDGAVNAGDAVRKDQMDTALALKLALSGGTMSGNINMNNNQIVGLPTPSVNNEAANKAYVDAETTARAAAVTAEASARSAEDLTFLKLSGARAMQGALPMGGNNITNCPQIGNIFTDYGTTSSKTAQGNDGRFLSHNFSGTPTQYQLLQFNGTNWVPTTIPPRIMPILGSDFSTNSASFVSAARMAFVKADSIGWRNFRCTLYANPSGNTLNIQVYDAVNAQVLGSLSGVSTAGIYSIPLTIPTNDGLIEVQIQKVSGGGSTTIRSAELRADI